jgi:hypothetical protein
MAGKRQTEGVPREFDPSEGRKMARNMVDGSKQADDKREFYSDLGDAPRMNDEEDEGDEAIHGEDFEGDIEDTEDAEDEEE